MAEIKYDPFYLFNSNKLIVTYSKHWQSSLGLHICLNKEQLQHLGNHKRMPHDRRSQTNPTYMEREYVKKGTPHCGASALPTNITPPPPRVTLQPQAKANENKNQ